ncbi:MAG: hypothetical protein FWD88_01435 [Treponema sp.]|nr:hypothetical protein [Treponema sp.]
MKTKTRYIGIRICGTVFILMFAAACLERNETKVLPPETAPLSHDYVGYGVINVMYTRLSMETTADSAASGHARMGTVVRIHERRLVREGGRNESWLLVEGESRGWIREELVNVYTNISQARTASEAMR